MLCMNDHCLIGFLVGEALSLFFVKQCVELNWTDLGLISVDVRPQGFYILNLHNKVNKSFSLRTDSLILK